MKKILTLGLILIYFHVHSQYPSDHKRDSYWNFGYGTFGSTFGGTELNFNSVPPLVAYITQKISLASANASICDTNGNFLFYTNGMYVADANYEIMPNGDTLNPGYFFNYYQGFGYRMPQGVIIIPMPGSNSLFYIIHNKNEYSPQYFALGVGSYYSIVDITMNNGFGDVVGKNTLYLSDTIDSGCLTATRHANGRDWWVIIPQFKTNCYFKFLLCPQGIIYVGNQFIGTPSTIPELGGAIFSPDGSKYCRYAGAEVNQPFRLEVFDFDRCTGELSNYRNLWYTDSIYAPSLSISPNSRYLYIGRQLTIEQYDLQSADIAASKQTVAVYDNFVDPLFPQFGYTTFFLQQLASDNKIYICTPTGTRFLHVIDQPDSAGIACNVLQHSVQLPTFNQSSIPNFPNFRLGPIDGSMCDTLGINIITSVANLPVKSVDFAIWPNPTTTWFNYKLDNQNFDQEYILQLSDISGHRLKEWKFSGSQTMGHYNLEDIPTGLYLLSLSTHNGEMLKTTKLAIIH